MIQRIISVITLIALCNFLFACTSTLYMSPDHFKRETQREIPHHKIVAVIQPSDSVRQFDNDGGRYDNCSDRIIGTDQDGESIDIPTANCRLRVETRRKEAPKISTLTPDSYNKKFDAWSRQNIHAAILNSDDTLGFYLGEGRLNSAGTSVCGMAKNGQFQNIDLTDVRLLEIKKEDETKGMIFVLGMVGLVALIYAISQWAPDFNLEAGK